LICSEKQQVKRRKKGTQHVFFFYLSKHDSLN